MDAFYRPVFLTTFFFVSGLFFMNRKVRERRYASKAGDIVMSILVPYLIYWILSFSVDSLLKGNYGFAGDLAMRIVEGRKLWFVSALFVTELMTLAYVAVARPGVRGIMAYMAASLAVFLSLPKGDYPWCVNVAFFSNFYFALGMMVKMYFERWQAVLADSRMGWTTVAVYCLLVVADVLWVHDEGQFHGAFANYPFFIFESFVGIHACLFVCTKVRLLKRPLMFIGYYSLLYYFFQHQVLLLTQKAGSVVGIVAPNDAYAVASAVFVAAALVVPIMLVDRFFPIMAGKVRAESVVGMMRRRE